MLKLPQLPERVKKVAMGFLSSQDPTAEVNLAAYGLGVATVAACLLVWTLKGPRDAALVGAFGVFMTGITTGLWRKGSNGPDKTKGPGAPGEGGGE